MKSYCNAHGAIQINHASFSDSDAEGYGARWECGRRRTQRLISRTITMRPLWETIAFLVVYTFCLKDINYRQRVAHRQGWKCKTDKGCEWTSTRHLILHTTDFIFTGCSCQVCSESERLQTGASIPACEY